MPGTTAGGTPYALSDDAVVQWPTTSQQVAEAIDRKMSKAGDTLTGPLVLVGPPTANNHAATKKYVDDVQTAARTYLDGIACPVGTVVAFSGSASIPANWRICDGGGGTPDLRGRFILGASGAHPAGQVSDMSETVTLSIANMPSHNHGGGTTLNGDHTHNAAAGDPFQPGPPPGPEISSWGVEASYKQTTATSAPWGNTSVSGNHTHGIPAEGSGVAFSKMPPFYALVYIMRVA